MAYSELFKNYSDIRNFMRRFYVYGFEKRQDFTAKSSRSYDDNRRRLDSWLEDYMSFKSEADGRAYRISFDSSSISHNPLYKSWKAKSFTSMDITLHFYLLDILADGKAYSAAELLVREQAFADSCLTIPKALQDGSWPLLQKDMTTPLRHAPAMPLTTLQRRWLKSLLTDKRIQLFDVDSSGLENVEPLFSEEQFVYFERYSDGDNYDDPEYKQHFRLLLQAITEKRRVEISFISGKNESVRKEYLPLQLEYSAKDDKFRLKAVCERHLHYVNVGRIKSCKMLEQTGEEACMLLEPERCAVTVLLTDERNALEWAMLNFSHLEKITERLDEKHYRLQLMYNKSDETEMVIRILSFGPLLRVQEAAGFIELLRHRLRKQLALRAKE